MKYIDNFLHSHDKEVDEGKFKAHTLNERFGKMVNMQTIFNCNLNCKFCRGSIPNVKELSKVKTMSQSNFELFVNKFADYGIKFIELTPAIGEPFLDLEFNKKLLYLEEKKDIEHYLVTTNLTLLQPKHFKLIKDLKKLILTVSLYGYDDSSYYENTNRKVFKKFKDKFDILFDLLNENVNFLLEINLRCGRDLKDFPKNDLYIKLLKLNKLDNVKINQEDLYNHNRGNNLKNFKTKKGCRSGICPFGPGVGGGVLPNGDFLFCPFNDINNTGIVGNLFKQSLEEIYDSDGWNKVVSDQKQSKYTGICENCTETW
tara:strand:- start:10277 stop:11221 length:945 start_codon:yes stop_codon:yes gene_type:complete